ncbi:MAG: hypothetical protein ACOCXP_03670, partial [Candidatus Dojkabacteria bacterium]
MEEQTDRKLQSTAYVAPTAKEERGGLYLIFEKIPALVFVGLMLFLLLGAFVWPTATAYLIIIINVYFLYKSATMAFYLLYVFNRIWSHEQ